MTLLAVGRVFDGYDVAPTSMSWDGDRLSLSGPIYIPTSSSNRYERLSAVRDRIRALVNNDDERHVPVTFTLDPALDGFYRPLAASITFEAHAPTAAHGTWSMTLERLGRGALPQIEVYSNYAHVDPSNALSATEATVNAATAIFISACPNDAYDAWNGYTSAGGDDRTSASGVLATWDFTPSAGAALPFSAIHRFTAEPADAYVGACSLRGTYAGVADQLCLGDMAPTTDGLVISNDLIRVKVTSGALTLEVYDSGAWVTTSATDWSLTGTAAAGAIFDYNAAPYVSVLRNSPEQVSVRLIGATSTTTTALGRMWLDITVQRGSMIASFTARADVDARWDVRASTVIAGTTINGGVRQTSNDANGNRLVVVGACNTRNTGQIGVSQSAAVGDHLNFGIGVELGGSAATGNFAAQKVAYEWFIGRSEAQRVVLR